MQPRWPTLVAFLGVAQVALIIEMLRFLPDLGPGPLIFSLAVLVSYSALYLAPVGLLALGLDLALTRCRRRAWPAWALLVSGASFVHLALLVDVWVHQGFGFHLNGFVWNIVRTRGGIDSLGGGPATLVALAGVGAAILAGHALALAGLVRLGPGRAGRLVTRRRVAVVLAFLAAVWLAQTSAFVVADAGGGRGVLAASGTFPLYARVTAKHLARRLGLGVDAGPRGPRLAVAGGALRYPLRPLTFAVERRRLNVVWLVSESLRADMVDPEVMPHVHRFAGRAQRFTNHLSGGCGTRMGMFSMFYGLWGPYWFPFLDERRGPVLLDHLLLDGYRVEARTSATFTYPEFDQTIWASVPRERLITVDSGDAWQRDRAHTDGLLRFIDAEPSAPFFGFVFFESPHARYSFPPDSVIRPDYLPELNYATMDVDRDLERMRSRYVNACHHLDAQIGRVIEHLDRRGLLSSTIVVITGDHGEEFMEHGRWGHNSAFVDEQVRTPLVLWVPGREPKQHAAFSSHLDLPATVLSALGATSPPSDYSQGHDLLGAGRRKWTVLADWDSVAYADEHDRIALPVGSRLQSAVVLRDDVPVDPAPALERHRAELLEIARGLGAFRR